MIVITGGAGFIGSNLVAALEARGAGPLVLCDRLGSDDKWRNIARRGLHALVTPEALPEYLARHVHEIEVVFHLGAISATTERNVDLLVANNIDFTLALFDWCASEGKPLIHASSAATYGDGSAGFDDDDSPEALARLLPLNAYGWSKHFVDRQLAARPPAHQPPFWAGLKFFNVYGPNEYHKGAMRSVACTIWPDIRDKGTCRLFRSHRPDFPDGGQLRDFVWVGDAVEIMIWLWRTRPASGLYNVGSGEARSFSDLAHATFAAAGKPARIEYVDMPEAIRDRYQYYTQANMTRLRQAGYNAPFTSLEEGVARYVEILARPDPTI